MDRKNNSEAEVFLHVRAPGRGPGLQHPLPHNENVVGPVGHRAGGGTVRGESVWMGGACARFWSAPRSCGVLFEALRLTNPP